MVLADAFVHSAWEKNVLFIALTDLSHHHDYREAVRLDRQTIRGLQRLDAGMFLAMVEDGRYELCGGSAVATLLMVAERAGGVRAVFIHYANSGDVTGGGGASGVVGYAAIALVR